MKTLATLLDGKAFRGTVVVALLAVRCASAADFAVTRVADSGHGSLPSATLHVRLESENPTPPYATWATAATNIQQAVNVAADGDIVVVAAGEYEIFRPIDFNPLRSPLSTTVAPPKNLTLRSEAGPERTVIRMTGWGPVVFFRNGETGSSRLEGFTLTGGWGWMAHSAGNTAAVFPSEIYGGGIVVDESSPEIRDCIIRGNGRSESDLGSDRLFGGGVACTGRSAAPLFVRCQIMDNVATDGGGVFCSLGSPQFVECTVSGNLAYSGGNGGGIVCADWPIGGANANWVSWSPVPADTPPGRFIDCRITDNRAKTRSVPLGNYRGDGGGITLWTTIEAEAGVRWRFMDCRIENNTAEGIGGAVYSIMPDVSTELPGTIADGPRVAVFERCAIRGNETVAQPGGETWGALYLYRTELRDCSVTGNRGGNETIGLISARLVNCTIARNPAGGVSDFGVLSVSEMHNSIVWGNGGTNRFPARLVEGVGNLSFNCIEGTPVPDGDGNINTDPRLDPDGRLSTGSPCIDAGNNAWVVSDTDLDVGSRIINGTVDMGAHEFVPWRRLRVTPGEQPGSFRLAFQGATDRSYGIEVSTNLVDWFALRVVQPDSQGACEFVDPPVPQRPHRFYRIVEP